MRKTNLLRRLRRACISAIAGSLALSVTAAEQSPAKPSLPADRDGLNALVRQFILDNPEVLKESFLRLRAREESEQQARAVAVIRLARSQLEADPSSPVMGNPAGKVTVVQFHDYNCGYCKKAAPELAELMRRDPDVRVVLKEYPILGGSSMYAARAALAANRQGRFAAFHDELMQLPQVDDTTVKTLAQRLKLDHARLVKDMESPEIGEAISRNYALASQLGISGTPAFVIGERLVPGAIEAAQMAELVAVERASRRKP